MIRQRCNLKIGERIRRIREQRQLSTDDLVFCLNGECCLSCIENGEKIPCVETVERIAEALGVAPYYFFYEGSVPPSLANLPGRLTADDIAERGMMTLVHRNPCQKSN